MPPQLEKNHVVPTAWQDEALATRRKVEEPFPNKAGESTLLSGSGGEKGCGLKQTLCAPGPRDPTETETELCLSVSCRGTGQQWTAAGAGALGEADLGIAYALLEEVAINPNHRAAKQMAHKQSYQRNSRTVKEVLGPTTDLPTWGSGKGTENPQGI